MGFAVNLPNVQSFLMGSAVDLPGCMRLPGMLSTDWALSPCVFFWIFGAAHLSKACMISKRFCALIEMMSSSSRALLVLIAGGSSWQQMAPTEQKAEELWGKNLCCPNPVSMKVRHSCALVMACRGTFSLSSHISVLPNPNHEAQI